MTQAKKSVLVSILNWNTAGATLACVDTVLALTRAPDVAMEVLVIDNGSRQEDYDTLVNGAYSRAVTVRREAQNHGFAGGHNLAIVYAAAQGYDFIWLLNSDALVPKRDTLLGLLAQMEADPRCGATAPLLAIPGQSDKLYFCGSAHDWQRRETRRPKSIEQCRLMYASEPHNMWLPGTALLLRMSALAEIGPLDQRLFAYYEDDDLGARLAAAGWLSQVAYDYTVEHAMPAREDDRPPYYHYLIVRNHLMFWRRHTPAPYRRALRLKLLDHAFFSANMLLYKGYTENATAALLGIGDYLAGRHGAPVLGRPVPLPVRLLRRLFWISHRRALDKMALVRAVGASKA